MNVADTVDRARYAVAIAGPGCLVRIGEDEPRYATVAEIAARLGPEDDMLMLLTAISEAVERYNPEREAVVMIESERGFEVSIVTTTGCESVGGLFSRRLARARPFRARFGKRGRNPSKQ